MVILMVDAHIKNENKKDSNKKNKIILVLIGIVIIILISVLTIYVYNVVKNINNTPKYSEYNKFPFQKIEEHWYTMISYDNQPYEAIFYNHPLELEDIDYDNNASILTLNKPHVGIVIAVAPNDNATTVLAASNIARITGKFYKLPTKSALYVPVNQRNDTNYSHLLVDCSEASEKIPIIYLNGMSNVTSVSIDENNSNCILIRGSSAEEIYKSADLYTYKILGIMK
jgi:heme/copper-type cytochrome/quinol oxidase subunit 2